MVMLPRLDAAESFVTVKPFVIASWINSGVIIARIPQFYRCPPCLAGTVCTEETAYSYGYPRYGCCAPGQVLCKGTCLAPCPGNQRMEGVNCTCACVGGDPGCVNGTVWDPVQCRCACPTTPCPDPAMTRDAQCVCRCPAPLTDCNGYCVDLLTNPWFCGSCSNAPCDPFTEDCCNGVCTNLCSGSPCGTCGRNLQPGEKCCNCSPRMLGTNQHCSDCNDACTGGRTCTNGSCRCPTGYNECAPGKPCCPVGRDCCANGTCCPSGQKCCNGVCTSTSTNANHCGTCGNKCPAGRVCVGGTCQCPSGTNPVGTCCCPAGQGCCNGVCTSLTTRENCDVCGNACFYENKAAGTALGWGTCDPVARRCRCPSGTVSVSRVNGEDLSCCPSATPRPCPHDPKLCCP